MGIILLYYGAVECLNFDALAGGGVNAQFLSVSLSLSLITWLLAVFVCYQRLKPPLLGIKWRYGISNGGDGWDAEEIILLT